MQNSTFSNTSIDMIEVFSKDNTSKCIPMPRWTNKTKTIFTDLFNDIQTANKYVEMRKKDKGSRFYNITIQTISQRSTMPRPSTFNMSSLPDKVRTCVENETTGFIEYSTKIHKKTFKVFFFVYDIDPIKHVERFSLYFERMVQWMHIAYKYGSSKCGNDLTVYVYMTPYKKFLPNNNIDKIGQDHANTAFTYSCPSKNSEIVIYREEEWFKVFIHETFHLMALDFSDANAEELCKQKMKKKFPIKSDFRLYETYTETWAVIIHTCMCAYFCFEDTHKIEPFIQTVKFLLGFETLFKLFQMSKIISFMGLDFSLLTLKTKEAQVARDTLYNEDTNVFAYHIATTLLLSNYVTFLEWCDDHNFTFRMSFHSTRPNIERFCDFVIDRHDSEYTQKIIKKMYDNNCYDKIIENVNSNKEKAFVETTMRMTICEMR